MYGQPQPIYDPINDPAPPGFNQEAWARRNKPVANFTRLGTAIQGPPVTQSGYMGPTAMPNGGIPPPQQVDPQRQQQEMVMQNAMAQARAMNLPMSNVRNPLQQNQAPAYWLGQQPIQGGQVPKGRGYSQWALPQNSLYAARLRNMHTPATAPEREFGTGRILPNYGQPRAPNGFPSSYQSRAPAYQSAYRSPLS